MRPKKPMILFTGVFLWGRAVSEDVTGGKLFVKEDAWVKQQR